MSQVENRIKNIDNLLSNADKSLRKAQRLLDTLSSDLKNSFEDVPGVLGIFDGENMVAADGQKYEVNPNYAAKSMLVVGDNLKMVEEDGKQLFKQVTKIPRKKLSGILNKKEGKWYALTDEGSYRVLDVAVDFRRGEVKDEITVLVPEEDLKAPFAALEAILNKEKEVEKEEKEEKKPARKAPKSKAKPAAKKAVKKEEKVAKKEEVVDSILEDDLV